MKRTILASFIVICSLLAVLPVSAQDASQQSVDYTSDARNARIAALKSKYKVKLSDKEKELIVLRCQAAGKAIEKILGRLKQTHASRTEDYRTVISTLSSLSAQLHNKQIDTSNLDLLIVSYQQKEQDFEKAVSAYELTLEDNISLDCEANPEDFRAALEGVREARKAVVAVSLDIQETTRASLKTTLDTIKLRLSTEVE